MIINGFGGSGEDTVRFNLSRAARDGDGDILGGISIGSANTSWPSLITAVDSTGFNDSYNITLKTYNYTANTQLPLNTVETFDSSGPQAARILWELSPSDIPSSIYGWPGRLAIRIVRPDTSYWTSTDTTNYGVATGSNYESFYYNVPSGMVYDGGARSMGSMTESYGTQSLSSYLDYGIVFGRSGQLISFSSNFLPTIRFYVRTKGATLNTDVKVYKPVAVNYTIKFLPCFQI